ncbi:chemotaxis response regulator containing a CheY-like receiver domain and a methylesterase domain [Rivularia sp. PCC 7116]|uniref:chemotaxis protein CheB n=1 Tax=Rivularia sp. PCC 7116 TaxID=373994 RepID=UPI00029F3E0B|nr:chemotaxis protein CheB [Rivularia sp. PCC 7116]AFY54884.1 chemotaxis response regulator containing a CheY-like receiver domain and a methylesterase domain [Rivularia sp. PCC 7116]
MTPENYIVVITASAGGLNAISEILSKLPSNFPAPIAIAQHLDPKRPSMLAEILDKRSPLSVKQAKAGDKLYPGKVYIAPPDLHLLVNPDGSLSLSRSEKVHYVRPAGDVLFKSVAASFKEKCIAVVLTGMDGDGAAGVQEIKKMGGIVIAQDKSTCKYPSMPDSAIQTGDVDFVIPLESIARSLMYLMQ